MKDEILRFCMECTKQKLKEFPYLEYGREIMIEFTRIMAVYEQDFMGEEDFDRLYNLSIQRRE